MKNKVMELMNTQMEARNVLALEIIEEAKESLKILGLEDLLNTGVATVTREVEVIKEVPVEVVKEIEVVREVPVEIIKEVEVPIKVIEEVEVVKEISSKEDKETIAKLQKELEAVKLELTNKVAMYQGLVKDLNDKIKLLSESKSSKSNAKVHVEQEVKTELPKELKVRNLDTHVLGTYKGIAFEAMKEIMGTTIYNPSRWDIKDELNEVLIANKLIQASREDKDMHRVECELGCCHEIDSNKFMGYVVVDTVSYNYVFNKNYNNGNGFASILNTKVYLNNPGAKFKVCKNKRITDAINRLIDKHHDNVSAFRNENAVDLLSMIGYDATTTNSVDNTTVNTATNITGAQLFEDETVVTTTNNATAEQTTTATKDTEATVTTQEELDEILAYGFDEEF